MYTYSMIKPHAVKANKSGNIISLIENAGFRLTALKKTQFSRDEAESFYAIHKGKDFFSNLINHMTSGPIIAMVLEKENAVSEFREFIGKTNPVEANEGTIRNLFGESITDNAIHASDSVENAWKEIRQIFNEDELF